MDLENIFKAYDIRGVVPKELDVPKAYAIGKAFAIFLHGGELVVGRDMRISSPDIAHAIMAGISDGGGTPVDIGMVSTDMVYFATGKYGYNGGVMITASHNPSEYNGMKMCREKAIPISSENGLAEIRALAETVEIPGEMKIHAKKERDVTDEWVEFALGFINRDIIKPFGVVVDAGNGMAGKIIPVLEKNLPLNITPMYFELDGNFPNHLPNPLDPDSLTSLSRRIILEGADLGMIFDGDADRVFILDEQGEVLSGTVTTAMVAEYFLKNEPKSTILYNAICGNIVPETVEKLGGNPVRTRVGHSLIKTVMAETDALFAGEHSGHYYYRDNYRADSALITACIILQMLSEYEGKLSDMCREYRKYPAIDETNFVVEDKIEALYAVKKHFADAQIDELDGITVRFSDYWFNIRPSNTEPVLRLNMEANNEEILHVKFREVLSFLSTYGKRA
jgi:phosphomannomutase